MIFCLTILSAWQLITYYPGYSFSLTQQGASNLCEFAFPDAATHAHYPAFLVVTQAMSMNLSNATINCSFALSNSPDAVFRFGGQGSWNIGSRPASARLFFSSVPGYNNAGTGSTNYWFYNPQWAEIGTNTTTATLTAQFNPDDWTDAGGCAACPPTTGENFWFAVQHVREIGLAFGGGSFYDTGIAVTGQSVFALTSFSVDPIVTIDSNLQVVGAFSQSVYDLEQSEDLISWHSATNAFDSEFFRLRLK